MVMKTKSKCVAVVAAVIKEGNKYLCMQRCRSGYEYMAERWEFPGGKVDSGENEYEALLREIKEEMDWDIFIGKKLVTIEHEYPDFIVRISAYLCKAGDGEFKLLEHLDYQWLTKEELGRLNWVDADKRIIEILQ